MDITSKRPTETARLARVEVQAGTTTPRQGQLDVGGPLSKDGTLLYRLTGLASRRGLAEHVLGGGVNDMIYIAPAFTCEVELTAPRITFLGEYQDLARPRPAALLRLDRLQRRCVQRRRPATTTARSRHSTDLAIWLERWRSTRQHHRAAEDALRPRRYLGALHRPVLEVRQRVTEQRCQPLQRLCMTSWIQFVIDKLDASEVRHRRGVMHAAGGRGLFLLRLSMAASATARCRTSTTRSIVGAGSGLRPGSSIASVPSPEAEPARHLCCEQVSSFGGFILDADRAAGLVGGQESTTC